MAVTLATGDEPSNILNKGLEQTRKEKKNITQQ